jgi:hypothetical protein
MLRLCIFALLCMFCAARPVAADTYMMIVSGASGGPAYAAKYDGWRNLMATTLKSTFGYPDDRVIALGEARKEQVQRALTELGARLMKDDVLVVALIGHGTDEKFNLAGPDMTASEWASQLKSVPARIVFVDTTSGSFPFFRQLAAPGRVVITATESTAQQFETVFPEFFIKAFTEPAADADKDGRVSVFEAFQYANAKVRTWFDQHNQLPTERALIDEEAVARATFLQPRTAEAGDAAARRQADLENAIAGLKARRSSMPAAAYDAELERLLTELARLMAR